MLGTWVTGAGVTVGVAGSIVGEAGAPGPEAQPARANAKSSAQVANILAVAAFTGSLRVHGSVAKLVRLVATVAPTPLPLGKPTGKRAITGG